jgi:hypothetical protein
MVCSTCGQVGHNKRTCSQKFSLAVVAREVIPCDYHDVLEEYEKIYESPPVLPALEVVAVVWEKWSVMSGDPMEMNLVTESEEVDISTEGFSWGDLPFDAVNLILDLVEKYNTEYHEDRVRMFQRVEDSVTWNEMNWSPERERQVVLTGGGFRIFRATKEQLGVLEVMGDHVAAENWQKTGRDLRRVRDHLDTKHRPLTPKNMKFKYLAEHTKYHDPPARGRRIRAGGGWWSWYHTLEDRENSLREEYWNRRSR